MNDADCVEDLSWLKYFRFTDDGKKSDQRIVRNVFRIFKAQNKLCIYEIFLCFVSSYMALAWLEEVVKREIDKWFYILKFVD